jgi:hypothetical protein
MGQILMAMSVKMAVPWDIVPCSLIEADGRFRGFASIRTIAPHGAPSQKTFNCQGVSIRSPYL